MAMRKALNTDEPNNMMAADQAAIAKHAQAILELIDDYSGDDCTASVLVLPAPANAESEKAFQVVVAWQDDAYPVVIFGDEF